MVNNGQGKKGKGNGQEGNGLTIGLTIVQVNNSS